MKLSKIYHRNAWRIRVDFPYNAETASKLRQIPDACWSKTLGAWHIPYSKEAFAHLKTLFPQVEYEKGTQAEKMEETILTNTTQPEIALS